MILPSSVFPVAERLFSTLPCTLLASDCLAFVNTANAYHFLRSSGQLEDQLLCTLLTEGQGSDAYDELFADEGCPQDPFAASDHLLPEPSQKDAAFRASVSVTREGKPLGYLTFAIEPLRPDQYGVDLITTVTIEAVYVAADCRGQYVSNLVVGAFQSWYATSALPLLLAMPAPLSSGASVSIFIYTEVVNDRMAWLSREEATWEYIADCAYDLFQLDCDVVFTADLSVDTRAHTLKRCSS